ncbi:MAG: exodeoxyribonuclease VII large subunit [Pseudomonadota bacterium]
MKQDQLDIFAVEAPEAKPPEGEARPKRARKPREVKKAPFIVDSYAPTEEVQRKTATPPLCKGRMGGVDQGLPPLAPPYKGGDGVQEAVSKKILTVSELTESIKSRIEPSFTDVWVSGEVTDFRNRTGRHYYFALKDESSKIRMVIFGAGEGKRVPFELKDGMEVICHGSMNVYAPQGSYSVIVDVIEPKGIGARELAFEQLKKKLKAEGLFARERKRPLPYLPRRIGVVTSETGAAIRDIVHVLTRRFPNIEILLHPVRVQGDGAAAEIAGAIGAMNSVDGLDLLIVGRGGGSIEDLWAFNEEIVARAIAASKLPVVSAVGHEIDFTIADFVADVRAATPSAAAEIAVPVRSELLARIAEMRRRLALALEQGIANRSGELKRLAERIGDPRKKLPDFMLRVDGLRERLVFAMNTHMDRRQQTIAKLVSNLDHLSPLGVLSKGYSVVTGSDGCAVRAAGTLKPGDDLNIRFHSGSAAARVTKVIN